MSTERERVAAWENWELAETLEKLALGETLPTAKATLQEAAHRLNAVRVPVDVAEHTRVATALCKAAVGDRRRIAWRFYAGEAISRNTLDFAGALQVADDLLEAECERFGKFEDAP